ncbi:MAG: 3-phosphoshikimate 1-carboxyvinyltransferase [Oscillospiraceae bacterium]|jgi:3-phosphoshikimate 1-carboxyvinyltransferase|nr:3-phosphoshikimate 1-carboxyvinyltransferase [Oscillospiraceae bacterium]
MIAVVHPGRLRGAVEVPASKSLAHRWLIAAALADAPTRIALNALNEDIEATANCLRALGAQIERTQRELCVLPIPRGYVGSPCVLNCGESGSTLRFLLPVATALGMPCRFIGAGRLPERPNAPLVDALNALGAQINRDRLPIEASGKLRGGEIRIAGNISSQYISGLLMALPLCPSDSRIRLTTSLESEDYVRLTLHVLGQFGIHVECTADGWRVPGGQRYSSPGTASLEADWSSAAFWLAANHLGSEVACLGLNNQSAQGDRAIFDCLNRLGGEIDASGIPDLVPVLAVAAAAHPGVTRIFGAARLRLKESDRLQATADLLTALGGQAEVLPDGLVIRGGMPLTGGIVDGYGDHRIVMAAAIAATVASGAVVIRGAEAAAKSYPSFFQDFQRLGGFVDVESDR